MAINNPPMETSNNLWSLNRNMIGITVFSKTMIRFSTLKHFWVKKVDSVMHDDAD